MNSGVTRVGGLLLILLVAVYFKFVYLDDDDSYVPTRAATSYVLDPNADGDHGIAVDFKNIPESGWLSNERTTALKYLTRADVSLLIAPVQGDKNAFDPVERSLITRLLSDHIAQLDPNYVADPGAVLQYLGTHRSTHSLIDIRTLANRVRAEKILVLRAEHDRDGRWSLSATLISTAGTDIETETWADLTFSDSTPPSASFMEIVQDVAEFATDRRLEIPGERPVFGENEFVFPETLQGLVEKSGESPLHAAAYLQLLGMLHPRGSFNETRDHLFERSLVELEKVPADVPFSRYFKARAYAYLDRRPAAVAVLGQATNRHEVALLAALNGDLPALQSYFEDDETSVLRFMAVRDLQKIGRVYGAEDDPDLLESFVEAHPTWAPLLYRSLRDYEDWANYSAAVPKYALDNLVPIDGVSLEAYVEAQAVVGDLPDEIDLTRLLWKHIEALESQIVKDRRSGAGAASIIATVDILELAKTITIANHLREVEEDLVTRVIPEAALEELDRFEPFYAGHPAVSLLRGRVLQTMAKDSVGPERNNLLTASREARANGFAWTGRLTTDAIEVARGYAQFRVPAGGIPVSSEFSHYSRRYFEWPRSSDWYDSFPAKEAKDGAIQACIDYRWTAFSCLKWKIAEAAEASDDPELVRSELLAQYADRFVGHPTRTKYAIELARAPDDKGAEIRALKARIEAGSTDLSLYYALGRIYKRRGEYKKAQEAWLSHPNFQANNAAESLAEIGHADTAGAMLFWIGQYELALPLLELAANGGTGSASNMTSSARVALIDGDLESAASWSANRVRRYDSKHGLRDFLQLLHLLGESELAWNTLEQFEAREQNAEMWSGALVGHRMESATIEEIAEWVQSSDSRRAAEARAGERWKETVSLGPRYLLLAGTMDRIPGPDFSAVVSSAYSRPLPRYRHRTTSPTPENGLSEPVESAIVRDTRWEFGHDPLVPTPQVLRHAEDDQEVDHRYTMLAGAMSAFLGEDYAQAYEKFNETAYYYYLDEYLPYYAFSAAALGREEYLYAALEAREAQFDELLLNESFGPSNLGYRFDEDLAYAVLAAFSGDHEAAMRSLRKALNNRPYLENRSVYPMYQVVDFADRLFEQTGEDVYREFALDLSRRHTIVLPMYSWAYFIVAKYSQADLERVSAAASGLHLDPLSHRATKLDRDLLDEATKLLGKSGAPYLRRGKATSNQTT